MNTASIRQYSQDHKIFNPAETWEQFPNEETWSAYKQAAFTVADTLATSPSHFDRAQRMEACTWFLASPEESDPATGEVTSHNLFRGWSCGDRWCPICRWRKADMQRAELLEVLKIVRTRAEFITLSLTVRNCDVSNLRATISALNKAFTRMIRRKEFRKVLKGWTRIIHVTKSDIGEVHPHFHCILALPIGYFLPGFSISKERWQRAWQEALGVNYLPEIDVYNEIAPRDHASLLKTVRYLFKYPDIEKDVLPASKDHNFFFTLDEQVKGIRFIAPCGVFKDAYKQVKCVYNARKKVFNTSNGVNTKMRYYVCDDRNNGYVEKYGIDNQYIFNNIRNKLTSKDSHKTHNSQAEHSS